MHSRRKRLAAALLAAIPLTCAASVASAIDWIGPGFDWNTASNWSPNLIPNSSSAVVNFNDTDVGALNISASVTIQSLNFNNSSGGYTLTSGSTSTLTVQSITVASNVTGTEILNLANISTGSLLFPAGNLTILVNSPTANLVIGTAVIGTPGSGGVVVNGPGNVSISSFVASGGNVVNGGLSKSGSGTLTFSGSGAGLSGGISLTGGTLVLDYSANTNGKFSAAGTNTLILNGGLLKLTPNATTSLTQNVPGGTLFTSGHTDILASGAGNLALGLGFTSRSTGATADLNAFALGTNFSLSMSNPNVVNSLVGNGFAYMTANGGATWATSTNGSTISGLASYNTNLFFSNISNTDITSNQTIASFNINSLRFNTGNLTLNLSGTNLLQSGGLLVTPGASGATISGGTLTSGNQELLFHVYDTAGLTVNSALFATSLTKTGFGNLTLAAASPNLFGTININKGNLTITNAGALGAATQLNFNDIQNFNAVQSFNIGVGDNTNPVFSQNIQISAFANTANFLFGTTFNNTINTNSNITLAGVISSASGQNTSLRFNNASNDGFTLANLNTFTGNINVLGGFLKINSDFNLGNASNVLFLSTTANPNSGLIFSTAGINLAHNIVNSSPSAISSLGSDVNTISGAISGAAWTTLGTGTIILTNSANSFSGLTIATGTVALSTDAVLGAANGVITLQGGTLETTASFTWSPSHALAFPSGTGTLSVDNGTTLTLPQFIFGPGTLRKTGNGTLNLTSTVTSTVSLLVAAGTLNVNGLTFNNAAFANNSLVIGNGTLSAGTGLFANSGLITVSSGPLILSGSGSNTNAGNISLNGPTAGLQLNGSGLSNFGLISLANANVTGSSTLSNSAGGTISGAGLISAPFTNNAGATLLNAAAAPLLITNPFANAGVIQVAASGASISGSLITNSGTITGFGTVANPVLNTTVSGVSGTIEPTGGTLLFANALSNLGTIRTATGTKILIQGLSTFPTNNGLISLAGGTFDTGGQPLTNSAQIAGFGILSTGGLTNDGAITLTGGISTVNGNLTNNAGKTINVQYQPALFTGNINNLGTINVTGTTVTFTGTYSGNAYHSDPATNIFQNSVSIATGGSMTGDSGDKFIFTGGAFTNNGTFKNAGLLQSAINFINAGSFTQSGDQSWAPGTTFTNDPGATAEFASDAGSPTSSPLSIIFNGGTVIFDGQQDLNAITINAGHLYVGPDFSYLTDSASPLPLPNLTLTPADLAFIASIPTPEPTSLALLALPAALLVRRKSNPRRTCP